jgi:hypothetical protein
MNELRKIIKNNDDMNILQGAIKDVLNSGLYSLTTPTDTDQEPKPTPSGISEKSESEKLVDTYMNTQNAQIITSKLLGFDDETEMVSYYKDIIQYDMWDVLYTHRHGEDVFQILSPTGYMPTSNDIAVYGGCPWEAHRIDERIIINNKIDTINTVSVSENSHYNVIRTGEISSLTLEEMESFTCEGGVLPTIYSNRVNLHCVMTQLVADSNCENFEYSDNEYLKQVEFQKYESRAITRQELQTFDTLLPAIIGHFNLADDVTFPAFLNTPGIEQVTSECSLYTLVWDFITGYVALFNQDKILEKVTLLQITGDDSRLDHLF